MSYLSPEQVRILRAETEWRDEVFGEDRIRGDIGQWQSRAEVKELRDVITFLCEEGGGKRGALGEQTRWLHIDLASDTKLVISANPTAGLGPRRSPEESELSTALASVRDIKVNKRLLKPRGLPVGMYAVHESLFIEPATEHAMIKKSLEGRSLFGRPVRKEAVKLATEVEVTSVFDMVLAATRADTRMRETQPEHFV